MTDCAEFYRERDRRTQTYLEGGLDPLTRPVAIRVARAAAETVAGQVAALALVELAARVHRAMLVDAPDVPLLVPAVCAPEARTLLEAMLRTANRVDPCGTHRPASTIPADVPTASIGGSGDGWQVGAHGATGILAPGAQRFDDDRATILGGAAAACLASAALLHLAYGRTPRPAAVSVWELEEQTGPPRRTGPAVTGPVSVGYVAVIGAGAVSAALAYWLRALGVAGSWEFVDADMAKLHNTNRTLALLPEHTGWNGTPQHAKAAVVADLIGAKTTTCWYDEWRPGTRPDLILPLANERDVRHLICARGEPVLLHATTGRDWEAQLHRHVAHRDQCIDCRFGHLVQARFTCSSAPHPEERDDSSSSDAALPFLSAAAGLMLAAALLRLSETGELADPQNWWGWRFLGGRRQLRRSKTQCRAGCGQQLDLAVIRAAGTGRFNQLLPESA